MQQPFRILFFDNLSYILLPEPELPPFGTHISDAEETEKETYNTRQRYDPSVNTHTCEVIMLADSYLNRAKNARYQGARHHVRYRGKTIYPTVHFLRYRYHYQSIRIKNYKSLEEKQHNREN